MSGFEAGLGDEGPGHRALWLGLTVGLVESGADSSLGSSRLLTPCALGFVLLVPLK